MSMKILASKASMDSAMKLRDSVEKLLKLKAKTILVSSDSDACAGHEVIMRYGCSYGNLSKEPAWGNKAFSSLCIDKLATSLAFKDLVTTPQFVNDDLPTEYPVLVRETLTAAQSAGIHVCRSGKDFMKVWKPGFFWTKYYDHEFELRVNVVFTSDGNHTRIYKKVPRTETGEDVFICGNAGEDNTHWVLRDLSAYPKVGVIINAMRPKILELGGKFVGIDMIYVPSLRDYVVLELNSGPWLTQTTSDWLAGIFIKDSKLGKPAIKYPVKYVERDGTAGKVEGVLYWSIMDSTGRGSYLFDVYDENIAQLVVKAMNTLKEQP